VVWGGSALGDGLLQRGAGGELHAVARGNLDLFAGAGVAAGAGGALDALDGEEAGDLDGLALSQGLNEDGLEDKLGTVHGH